MYLIAACLENRRMTVKNILRSGTFSSIRPLLLKILCLWSIVCGLCTQLNFFLCTYNPWAQTLDELIQACLIMELSILPVECATKAGLTAAVIPYCSSLRIKISNTMFFGTQAPCFSSYSIYEHSIYDHCMKVLWTSRIHLRW